MVKNSDADGVWNYPIAKTQFDTLMNAFMTDALSYDVKLAIKIMRDAINIERLAEATAFTKLLVWPRMCNELYPFMKDAPVSY